MTDTAQTAFWTAMLAAQKEIQNLRNDGDNSHFDSKYITLHKLSSYLRPILNAHGLVVTQAMDVLADGKSVVRTRITHTGGGYHEGTTPVVYEKLTAQAMVSGVTYARRAGLASFFCVAGTDEDDDGNAATEPAKRQQAAPQRAATPAPRPAAAPKEEKPYQFVADAIGDVEAAKSLQALNKITFRASVSEWCKGAEKEEFIRARDARKAELAPAVPA